MKKAGCVGINFTGDSADAEMLGTYRQPHRREDLAKAVRLCRQNGIKVMIDLLLGGPGETPEITRRDDRFHQEDQSRLCRDLAGHPHLSRDGHGPDDPTAKARWNSIPASAASTRGTSISSGRRSTSRRPWARTRRELVKDLIAGDQRFFEPMDETARRRTRPTTTTTTTPSWSTPSRQGARGAYWDILHSLRR